MPSFVRIREGQSLVGSMVRLYTFLMPTVLRVGPYRFHFYSDEGNGPPHVHVATADGEAKFWLDPVRIAANIRLTSVQVREIERLVFAHQTLLKEKYNEFHG